MIKLIIKAVFWFVVALLLLYPLARAKAQDRHDIHHPSYQNWVNQEEPRLLQ